MAVWWDATAKGPQGRRAQAQPSPSRDPWRGDVEGVGGRPLACWNGRVRGSPAAPEEGQGRDGGTPWPGSSGPLPPVTSVSNHLRVAAGGVGSLCPPHVLAIS